MLWEAIHVLHLWKAQVKGDGLRAVRLAVCVALEAFLPPPLWIPFLHTPADRLLTDRIAAGLPLLASHVSMVAPSLASPLIHCTCL